MNDVSAEDLIAGRLESVAQAPAPASLAMRVLSLAAHLSSRIDHLVRRHDDLAVVDYRVLRFLHDEGGRSVEHWEITTQLRISAAQVTKVVNRLAERELVRRRVHPQDRRRRWIGLTQEGARLTDDLTAQVADIEDGFLRHYFTRVEWEQLDDMLERLDRTLRS
jgi:DNA-binding MarR family transcriptional regulator